MLTSQSEWQLGRFSKLLEETEHFCGGGQEKVAKIVQCGEQFFFYNSQEATRGGGLKFFRINRSR
jgi:hypothetical protein